MSHAFAVRTGRPALAALVLTLGLGTWPSGVVAQAQSPWVAPEAEKAKKNPTPNDKKTVEQGEKVAKVNCVSCHGVKGKGDGPAAVALTPKPADGPPKRAQALSAGATPCPRTT